jgi:hypothetical protein
VFSHLLFGILFVDPHLRVVDMNAAAEWLLMRPGALHLKASVLSVAAAGGHAALQRPVIDACDVRGGLVPGVGATC